MIERAAELAGGGIEMELALMMLESTGSTSDGADRVNT